MAHLLQQKQPKRSGENSQPAQAGVTYPQATPNVDHSSGRFSAPNSRVHWGGRPLSGRVPPSSLEQNELQQLLGTQEGGCPWLGSTCPRHRPPGWLAIIVTETQVHVPDTQDRPNNTETSESGTEKGLLQGHARRWVAHASKTPNSSSRRRRWKSKTRRSPSSPQIHKKYIYTWNCSYRTPTER